MRFFEVIEGRRKWQTGPDNTECCLTAQRVAWQHSVLPDSTVCCRVAWQHNVLLDSIVCWKVSFLLMVPCPVCCIKRDGTQTSVKLSGCSKAEKEQTRFIKMETNNRPFHISQCAYPDRCESYLVEFFRVASDLSLNEPRGTGSYYWSFQTVYEPLIAEEVARHVCVAVIQQNTEIAWLHQLLILLLHALVYRRVFRTHRVTGKIRQWLNYRKKSDRNVYRE